MNSYKNIESAFHFQNKKGSGFQLNKILEEVNEVCEIVGTRADGDKLSWKKGGTYENLVMELLDIKLAVDNMLNKLETEYGSSPLKSACSAWDKKIIDYKKGKYND